jgi:hypothetical protein
MNYSSLSARSRPDSRTSGIKALSDESRERLSIVLYELDSHQHFYLQMITVAMTFRVFDRRCAFSVAPKPFESQNTTHHQYDFAVRLLSISEAWIAIPSNRVVPLRGCCPRLTTRTNQPSFLLISLTIDGLF